VSLALCMVFTGMFPLFLLLFPIILSDWRFERDGTELRGVYTSKPKVARAACKSLGSQCNYPLLLGGSTHAFHGTSFSYPSDQFRQRPFVWRVSLLMSCFIIKAEIKPFLQAWWRIHVRLDGINPLERRAYCGAYVVFLLRQSSMAH
jgi:hypothetical protein